MKKFKRVFVIVADSMGVGELPDAAKYGDVGTNTLKHLSYSKDDFNIPTLQKLGLGNVTDVNNTPSTDTPLASFGNMKEVSAKDMMANNPEKAMMLAVTGMLPHTSLGRKMATKLRVYAGAEHEHTAQKPEVWEVK